MLYFLIDYSNRIKNSAKTRESRVRKAINIIKKYLKHKKNNNMYTLVII